MIPNSYRNLQNIYNMYKYNNTKNKSSRSKIHKMAWKGTIIPISSKPL